MHAYLGGCEEESWVLRVERVEGDRGLVGHVELEVHRASREDDHVARQQRGGEQLVVVAHEARVHAALEHEQSFGGARVRVQRHHAPHGEVQSRVRDALRVDARVIHGRGQHGNGARGGLVHVADCSRLEGTMY